MHIGEITNRQLFWFSAEIPKDQIQEIRKSDEGAELLDLKEKCKRFQKRYTILGSILIWLSFFVIVTIFGFDFPSTKYFLCLVVAGVVVFTPFDEWLMKLFHRKKLEEDFKKFREIKDPEVRSGVLLGQILSRWFTDM